MKTLQIDSPSKLESKKRLSEVPLTLGIQKKINQIDKNLMEVLNLYLDPSSIKEGVDSVPESTKTISKGKTQRSSKQAIIRKTTILNPSTGQFFENMTNKSKGIIEPYLRRAGKMKTSANFNKFNSAAVNSMTRSMDPSQTNQPNSTTLSSKEIKPIKQDNNPYFSLSSLNQLSNNISGLRSDEGYIEKLERIKKYNKNYKAKFFPQIDQTSPRRKRSSVEFNNFDQIQEESEKSLLSQRLLQSNRRITDIEKSSKLIQLLNSQKSSENETYNNKSMESYEELDLPKLKQIRKYLKKKSLKKSRKTSKTAQNNIMNIVNNVNPTNSDKNIEINFNQYEIKILQESTSKGKREYNNISSSENSMEEPIIRKKTTKKEQELNNQINLNNLNNLHNLNNLNNNLHNQPSPNKSVEKKRTVNEAGKLSPTKIIINRATTKTLVLKIDDKEMNQVNISLKGVNNDNKSSLSKNQDNTVSISINKSQNQEGQLPTPKKINSQVKLITNQNLSIKHTMKSRSSSNNNEDKISSSLDEIKNNELYYSNVNNIADNHPKLLSQEFHDLSPVFPKREEQNIERMGNIILHKRESSDLEHERLFQKQIKMAQDTLNKKNSLLKKSQTLNGNTAIKNRVHFNTPNHSKLMTDTNEKQNKNLLLKNALISHKFSRMSSIDEIRTSVKGSNYSPTLMHFTSQHSNLFDMSISPKIKLSKLLRSQTMRSNHTSNSFEKRIGEIKNNQTNSKFPVEKLSEKLMDEMGEKHSQAFETEENVSIDKRDKTHYQNSTLNDLNHFSYLKMKNEEINEESSRYEDEGSKDETNKEEKRGNEMTDSLSERDNRSKPGSNTNVLSILQKKHKMSEKNFNVFKEGIFKSPALRPDGRFRRSSLLPSTFKAAVRRGSLASEMELQDNEKDSELVKKTLMLSANNFHLLEEDVEGQNHGQENSNSLIEDELHLDNSGGIRGSPIRKQTPYVLKNIKTKTIAIKNLIFDDSLTYIIDIIENEQKKKTKIKKRKDLYRALTVGMWDIVIQREIIPKEKIFIPQNKIKQEFLNVLVPFSKTQSLIDHYFEINFTKRLFVDEYLREDFDEMNKHTLKQNFTLTLLQQRNNEKAFKEAKQEVSKKTTDIIKFDDRPIEDMLTEDQKVFFKRSLGVHYTRKNVKLSSFTFRNFIRTSRTNLYKYPSSLELGIVNLTHYNKFLYLDKCEPETFHNENSCLLDNGDNSHFKEEDSSVEINQKDDNTENDHEENTPQIMKDKKLKKINKSTSKLISSEGENSPITSPSKRKLKFIVFYFHYFKML
jgi:hypothetical protein